MSASDESPTLRALRGGFRLCQFDAESFEHFDASVAGFWHSFRAALICLPLHLGVVHLVTLEQDAGPLTIVNYALVFFIQWLAWPLAAKFLAERYDSSRNFLRYAVAYNWMNAPQIALFSAVVLFGLSGRVPAAGAQLMVMACFIYVLVVKGWVAQRGLDCSGGRAAVMVVADVLINLLIAGVVAGVEETIKAAGTAM